MPVDRDLAYESLKWAEPKVYRLYLRLRYRAMTEEQTKQDAESFYKLWIFRFVNDALDRMEGRELCPTRGKPEEFHVRITKEPEEIKGLLEVGFEYVCEKDGLLLFRKRK
jgi:hypothetical protein